MTIKAKLLRLISKIDFRLYQKLYIITNKTQFIDSSLLMMKYKENERFVLPDLIKKKFRFLKMVEADELSISFNIIDKQEIVENYLPYVYNVADIAIVKLIVQPRKLYQFENVEVIIGSDFFIKNDSVFWEKVRFSNFKHLIPLDQNLLDFTSDSISLINREVYPHVLENAIFLAGVHSDVWSHFILERLECVRYVSELVQSNGTLVIILPEKMDSHCLNLLKEETDNQNIDLIFISKGTLVQVKNLFYIERGSILADHGVSQNIHDNIIRPSVKAFLSKYRSTKPCVAQKIFLGRKGVRNISNYDEILGYFQKLGFTEIFPDQLSLQQKREIFGSASHIVGPFSSAFTNLIFTNDSVRVLALVNESRAFDPVWVNLMKNPENYFHLTGREYEIGNIHSTYSISLGELDNFILSNNFLR